MHELSRISLGEKPNLEKGISELQIMKLGEVEFKVYSDRWRMSIKSKSKSFMMNSNFGCKNMLSSRDRILEGLNDFLERNDFYLSEVSFYPEKYLGIITSLIEGVLYKKDSIDD